MAGLGDVPVCGSEEGGRSGFEPCGGVEGAALQMRRQAVCKKRGITETGCSWGREKGR